jgi:hypothetical protein
MSATANLTLTPLANCPGLPAWSGANIVYVKGQEVGYNGHAYICLEDNTSQTVSYPSAQPSLWIDEGSCGTTPTVAAGGGTPVVYPNPNPGQPISIHLPSSSSTNIVVKIFTLSMRRVQYVIFPHFVPGTDISLPLTDSWGYKLANGLYYVVVESGSQRTICKLLVIR